MPRKPKSEKPPAERVSMWGVVSLLLFVATTVIGEYNFRLEDAGHARWFSRMAAYQLCAAVQLTAAIFAVIAARRSSTWWWLLVLAAGWMALVCFMSEV